MSTRIVFRALLISAIVVLLVALPVMARAITYTETFHDETMVFPDVTICDEIPAMVELTFNGVLHETVYTDDSPNAGNGHARFSMNFDVVVTDETSGALLETAHGVKTIFHDNFNSQNSTSHFNFVSVGSGPVGRHQYHFDGHINWNANGNPVEIDHVNVNCQ